MNTTWIITAFVIIDDLMSALGNCSHLLAQVGDAEMLAVVNVTAKHFQSLHERALCVTRE